MNFHRDAKKKQRNDKARKTREIRRRSRRLSVAYREARAMQKQYIGLIGNMSEGYRVIGPYSDADEVVDVTGEDVGSLDFPLVLELLPPIDPDNGKVEDYTGEFGMCVNIIGNPVDGLTARGPYFRYAYAAVDDPEAYIMGMEHF